MRGAAAASVEMGAAETELVAVVAVVEAALVRG